MNDPIIRGVGQLKIDFSDCSPQACCEVKHHENVPESQRETNSDYAEAELSD